MDIMDGDAVASEVAAIGARLEWARDAALTEATRDLRALAARSAELGVPFAEASHAAALRASVGASSPAGEGDVFELVTAEMWEDGDGGCNLVFAPPGTEPEDVLSLPPCWAARGDETR